MDTVIVLVITIVMILASAYLVGVGHVNDLKKNWPQHRCNPLYMPLAGLVGKDVATNFIECTTTGFQHYTGLVMDPVMAEFSVVNETLGEITDTMGSMRSMFSGVRGGFLGIVGSVFGKIQNVMSQTQYIVIRMRTLLGRIVGIMYSFVYVFYGGMQAGQSLVNGPVGKTMNLMACFHEDTKIQTLTGLKAIKDVNIGDRLSFDMAVVTSVYKIIGRGYPLYELNGVLVTENHKVKYGKTFICVKHHPAAVLSTKTTEHLICLNTTSHRIVLNNIEFLDFDESEDSTFIEFKNSYIKRLYDSPSQSKGNHHKKGVLPGTRIPLFSYPPTPVEEICIGDKLDNGDIVLGICKHRVKTPIYSELDVGLLVSPETWVLQQNKLRKAYEFGNLGTNAERSEFIVYQLITSSSTYPVVGLYGNRCMILDELETMEPHYHRIKDSIITSGRFRNKRIVI